MVSPPPLKIRSDAFGARRLRARRLAGVHQQGGLVHFAGEQRGHGLERARNALFDRGALVGRRLFQHPVDDLGLHARMPDAQPQAPIVARAQLGVDVAQAVVARMAAAELELGLAGQHIELVVDHEDFVGRDLEEARQRGHRFPGEIHERPGLEQPHGLAMQVGARDEAVVAAVVGQREFQFAGERVDPPEADIVARGFVFGARVAQSDEQLDHESDYRDVVISP
jgi:hypothetical protein